MVEEKTQTAEANEQKPAETEDYSFDMELSDEKPIPPPKPKKSKKRLLVGLLVVAVVGFGSWWFLIKNDKGSPSQQSNTGQTADTQKETIRLIGTGDNIPHDAINNVAEQTDGTYIYDGMYGDSKTWFDRADVRFCNQPTLAGGDEFGISGYPIFNAPLEFSKSLSGIGCNVINLGSNHTFDKTQAVIDATVDGWKDMPGLLAVAGANKTEEQKQEVRYFDNNGVKFAFVSYTTYSNRPPANSWGVTMYSDSLAKKQIGEAKEKADIVLVSMRWGSEYSTTANSAQRSLANKLSDMGADVILGHGPHVLQPYEEIQGDDSQRTLVWYSLGNYLNAQLEPETLFNGIAVMDISVKDKTIQTVGYMPVYMHYEWTAQEAVREDLLARKNFTMYSFADASAAVESSHLDTSLEAQTARITDTLSTYDTVKILTKDEYLNK